MTSSGSCVVDCPLFVLDPLLERGGDILGVVDESVPVAVLRLQDRINQQCQLLVLQNTKKKCSVSDSVPDPEPNLDPDPPDPHVFGPPGSGSTSQRYRMDPDPDPSIIKQK